MKPGNSDPSLALFPEKVTPNHHKLAREFVLLDNFYVNADVSADGHNWSTAAIASDYVEKMWPNSYGHRRKLYDYEGQEPAAISARRLSLDQRRGGGTLDAQLRLLRLEPALKPVTDGMQIDTVRDPVLEPCHQPAAIAASIWIIPTSSAPRNSCATWRNSRRPATMPQLLFMRLRQRPHFRHNAR